MQITPSIKFIIKSILVLSVTTQARANVQFISISQAKPQIEATPKQDLLTTSPQGLSQHNFKHIINKYAHLNGISPSLLTAIIRQESAFNPTAISPKGAMGLMQVMPATAEDYGTYNLLVPTDNIEVGSQHLSRLIKKYDKLYLALAAYNAGEGNVDKYDGIPPFLETQNYVIKVLKYYNLELDNRLLALRKPNMQNSKQKVVSKKQAVHVKDEHQPLHKHKAQTLFIKMND